jgi:hypothetical protein
MSSLSLYSAEKTHKTPYIHFDPATGDFVISGKSVPENVVSFYKPLMSWLDDYGQSPHSRTVLNVQLDYFNTSSAKGLVDIFKKIELIQLNGKGEVQINWMYDENDEDMMEAGDDFKSTVKVPVNLVPFSKED